MMARTEFNIRNARLNESATMVEIVRRSIIELCEEDHQNDRRTIALWLENKTASVFARWMSQAKNTSFVAVNANDVIAAVAMINRSGEILLLYVSPDFIRRGVGTRLLTELEYTTRQWPVASMSVCSTITAKNFYLKFGFRPENSATAWTNSRQTEKLVKPIY